jgi:hypothetical protein
MEDIKDANERYIDAFIQKYPHIHATLVYEEPRMEHRHHMWANLVALKASSPFCGEFLEILMKHYGNMNIVATRLRLELQMAGFQDCLHVCELKDHGFSGLPYTYDNK